MRGRRRAPGRYRRPPNAVLSGAAFFAIAFVLGYASGIAILDLARGARPPGRAPSRPPGESPRAKPVFTDVTAQAGIRFRHEAGRTGKFYYPEVMGAGCAFFDADGDGRLDIYFVNGNRLPPDEPSAEITNALYRNRGDGTFEDVTVRAGVGDASYGQGCCAADYDGDGDQDLYVTNFGPNVFYRNRGDGTFEAVEGLAADEGWGQSCAFFDADGDNRLDLYLQNYLEYSIGDAEEWTVTIGGQRVLDYCSPTGYPGQQDRLFLGQPGGTFREFTQESGIVRPEGTGMGLACADFDGDGRMDIAVANDSRPNFYFRNLGGGRFEECAVATRFAYNADGVMEAFMGIDVGDFDGDGLLDMAVPALKTEGFNLYRNAGGAFVESALAFGADAPTRSSTGFAPVFLDYDSDGDLDLFFTCGEVRMGRTESAGMSRSSVAEADASFIERYAMRCLLLENRGGRFVNVSDEAGPFFQVRAMYRSASAGDYDDDGDLDIVVTTTGGPAVLLRNDTKGGHWIGIALEGRPPNRDAVGATLALRAGGKTQVRQVFAGGSYLGQRDRRQIFGLGPAAAIDVLRIRWPDGEETIHEGLAVDRYHAIRQGFTPRTRGRRARR